jgi:hypothetical protein
MARFAAGSSIPRMSLHARRIRVLLATAAIAALAGCGSRDSTAGQPRNISPSMSESTGGPLLFQESKSYLWTDNR